MNKLKFIGTSAGRMSAERYFSSIYISTPGHNLLIDCGDGISKALVKSGVPFNDINSLAITHLHPDHITGLASLLVQMKAARSGKLTVYIHNSLRQALEDYLKIVYLFPERIEFPFEIVPFEYDKEIAVSENLKFIARLNTHLDEYKDNVINTLQSLSCVSLLINAGEKNIFYTSDIGEKKDLFIFKGTTIDIMISETAHADLEEIRNAAEEIKAAKLYLTHYNDEKGEELHKKLSLPQNTGITLATDGLEIIL